MKIRSDFITNSSSTSFMIIGVCDKRKVGQLAEAQLKKLANPTSRGGRALQESDLFDYTPAGSSLVFKAGQGGFEDGELYAGLETDVLENFTLPQARAIVARLCEELSVVVAPNEITLHCESWYDG